MTATTFLALVAIFAAFYLGVQVARGFDAARIDDPSPFDNARS